MEFQLRPITQDDYPRMAEIMAQQLPDPPTVDDLMREDKGRFPDCLLHRVAVDSPEGTLVGYGAAGTHPNSKPGHMHVNVRVDEAWQGRGIGGAIWQELERFAAAHQATAFEAGVRDCDDSHLAWAQRRGFFVEHHAFESKLDLAQFDPEPFRPAVAAAEAAGFQFTSLAAYPQGRDLLQRFLDFAYIIQQDIPGMDGRPPISVEDAMHHLENSYHWDPADIILAADGDRWVAMAHLQRQSSGGWYNSGTGVLKEYRGRGLATAIKVVATEYAKRMGAPYIRTHNHSVNAPMLAINRKFGYQPEPGVYQLLRKIG